MAFSLVPILSIGPSAGTCSRSNLDPTRQALTFSNHLSDWVGRTFRSAFIGFSAISFLLVLTAGCTSDAGPADQDATATFLPLPSATAAIATSTAETTPKLEATPTREPPLVEPAVAPMAPEPSPTPRPVESPRTAGQDLLKLQENLTQAIEEYAVPGNYAIAVTDLQTGETISVRGGERQMSGCSVNLFVLYKVVLDLKTGKYDLDRVDRLVRATTWSSSAVTARDLYAVIGDGDGDATKGVRRAD